MKYIHILPTSKPSRVFITKDEGLGFDNQMLENSELNCQNQNIYITSDEEIKEGDWCYDKMINKIWKVEATYNIEENIKGIRFQGGGLTNSIDGKKIILTTDQDLIKDGVQAIDDEFLEWFVNNQICEYDVYKEEVYYYKIIIPKEELKQETIDNFYCGNEVDYDEQCQNQCDRCVNATGVDYGKLNIKQETIEEAIAREFPLNKSYAEREAMFVGVKWQQERSYSGEGSTHLRWVYNRLIEVHDESPNYDYMIKFKELIEQFEKK